MRDALRAGAIAGIGTLVTLDASTGFTWSRSMIRMGKEAAAKFVVDHTYYKDLTRTSRGTIHMGMDFVTKALVRT